MEQMQPQILGSPCWVILPPWRYDEPIADFVHEEFTLGWLELQSVLCEMLKNNVQVM